MVTVNHLLGFEVALSEQNNILRRPLEHDLGSA